MVRDEGNGESEVSVKIKLRMEDQKRNSPPLALQACPKGLGTERWGGVDQGQQQPTKSLIKK
jgi:hypothetical protein